MTDSATDSEFKWIACMFHKADDADPKEQLTYIKEKLLEYDIGLYIIGTEQKPYIHYHVVFQGTDKIYNKWCKKIREKYSLRGRAQNGKPRQYGKVKTIENLEKMKAYTVKEKNVISNMDDEQIQHYINLSEVHDNKYKEHEKLVEAFDTLWKDKNYKYQWDPYFEHLDYLKKWLINYMIKEDIQIGHGNSRSFLFYLVQHSRILQKTQRDLLFHLIKW